MRYKREIELAFDLQQRQNKQPPQISLRYIATPSPPPPEKEFFLRHIRTHLLPSLSTTASPRRLLTTVAGAWDKAAAVTEQIRRLNLSFPTTVAAKEGGEGVGVTASVLLVPLQTRVEVVLSLAVEEEEVVVTPEARVVYGEGFNAGKMGEFLRGRVGGVVSGGGGAAGWDEAVLELYGMLAAKGRRRE